MTLNVKIEEDIMAYSTPFSQPSFSTSSMYLKSGGMGAAMGAYHMGLGSLGMGLDPMHAYGTQMVGKKTATGTNDFHSTTIGCSRVVVSKNQVS